MDFTSILSIGTKLIDKLIPDPAAKDAAKLKLLELQQQGALAELQADTELAKAQLDVNNTEASNSNPFVSGWRPAIGWVCAIALFYNYVFRPITNSLFVKYAGTALEPLDVNEIMVLVTGMLGLGGLRSFDKMKGTSK